MKKLLAFIGAAALAAATPIASAMAEDMSVEHEGRDSLGAGRISVTRMYSPWTGEHLMTVQRSEVDSLLAAGWYDEGTSFESNTEGDAGVHRLYNRVSHEHHYTADANEIKVLAAGDWNDEGESFRAYSSDSAAAPVAVYRLYNGHSGIGSHHYTTSKSEYDTLVAQGWRSEGVAFRVVKEGVAKPWPAGAPALITLVDVLRAYNPASGEHLYTTNSAELASLVRLGWFDEGVGWRSPSWSGMPVKRLYNPALGDHHYTTDAKEAAALVRSHGWRDEGVSFYSSQQKEVAVYRQFNPAAKVGAHNFTTSKAEYDTNNASAGWRGEGVAWYAKAGGSPKPHPSRFIDCGKEKCVAFTFDDGPTQANTPRVLDVLKKWNAKGTFFVTGENAARFPAVIRREVAEGHQVASHTWSHPRLDYSSVAAINSELDRTDAAVSSALGFKAGASAVPAGMAVSGGQLHTQYMRPPYGAVNATVKDVLRKRGQTPILWSVDTLDWQNRSAEISTRNAKAGIRPGSIVLWHDLHPVAGQALDGLLRDLAAQGYHFVTVQELLGGGTNPGVPISSR